VERQRSGRPHRAEPCPSKRACASVVNTCMWWLKGSPRLQGRAGLWRLELHRAHEVSNLASWKEEDTKRQLLAPGVWCLPADAGGAPGDAARKLWESQDLGQEMGQPSGPPSHRHGAGNGLCCCGGFAACKALFIPWWKGQSLQTGLCVQGCQICSSQTQGQQCFSVF